jgi:hypothetical protein
MAGKVNEAFRFFFSVALGDGSPATGIVSGDFTVTVRNPQDTATMAAPTVTEVANGQYYFDILAAFTNTHGAGQYGVTIAVDSTTPKAKDVGGVTIPYFARDVDDVAQPGDAMDLVADSVDASAVATSGAQEIRDEILADSTPFNGANIDAAISSRATPADITAAETTLLAQHTATQAAIAALNDLSIADVQTALTNQGYTAVRAALLDNLTNLDAAVSSVLTAIGALNDLSQADVQSAMTAQGYTTIRAALLDNLDAAVSAVLTAIGALNDIDQAGVQAALTAQGYTVGRAPLLDNLDATISGVPAAVDRGGHGGYRATGDCQPRRAGQLTRGGERRGDSCRSRCHRTRPHTIDRRPGAVDDRGWCRSGRRRRCGVG